MGTSSRRKREEQARLDAHIAELERQLGIGAPPAQPPRPQVTWLKDAPLSPTLPMSATSAACVDRTNYGQTISGVYAAGGAKMKGWKKETGGAFVWDTAHG